MRYDSVLFDLDGTLWDATESTAEAWKRTLALRTFATPTVPLDAESIKKYMGMTNMELTSVLFPDLEYEVAYNLREEASALENEILRERGGKLYDGVEELLVELVARGLKLFVVSNCQAGYIEAFLAVHGLERYFTDFECSGNTGRSKGENVLDVISRNGLASPVFVGDTSSDLKGAAFAGIPFIYARYGLGEQYRRGRVENYNVAIDSLSELVGVIEK